MDMIKRGAVDEVIKILQERQSLFPGSLNKLTQMREKGKSRSYWYLTWKEGGGSQAIYIPPQDVPRVMEGIENMKKIRETLAKIADENLRKLRKGRDVKERR